MNNKKQKDRFKKQLRLFYQNNSIIYKHNGRVVKTVLWYYEHKE